MHHGIDGELASLLEIWEHTPTEAKALILLLIVRAIAKGVRCGCDWTDSVGELRNYAAAATSIAIRDRLRIARTCSP